MGEHTNAEESHERVDLLNLSGWQITDKHEDEDSYRFTRKVTGQAFPYLIDVHEHELLIPHAWQAGSYHGKT